MGPSQVGTACRGSVPASIGWAKRPSGGAARGSLRGPDDRPHPPARASRTRPPRTGRTTRVGPVAGPQFGGTRHPRDAGQPVHGASPHRGPPGDLAGAGSRSPCSRGASWDLRPRRPRPGLRTARLRRRAIRRPAGRVAPERDRRRSTASDPDPVPGEGREPRAGTGPHGRGRVGPGGRDRPGPRARGRPRPSAQGTARPGHAGDPGSGSEGRPGSGDRG